MSDINNIKNWSDVHLKEDDNDSDELTDVKHVEQKWCIKARREEEDRRKAEAVKKAAEEVKRKVEEAKKRVSNVLPHATAS